jgi:alkylation response protein AidB-like acyl-CoA dehydrogenase
MHNKAIKGQPLGGGEFLIKDIHPDDLFIPEEFDEDAKMIREMVRDFVEDMGERVHEMDAQVPLMEQAGELGLLGAHMPESFGGMALPTNTNTMISEELGKAGGSFDTTFAAHTGIGMLPILYFGTEAQKEKYLPGLIDGSLRASYCLTEPGAGSDALSGKTKASMNGAGTHYLIEGQKMWISNAGFAEVFIVFAKIDGEHFTGFIVDAKSEGITLGAEEQKMGIKGSSTRQVFFEKTPVPVENILGEIGKGHLIAFNALNIGRFKLGSMAMGGCKIGIDISVKYANERIQFKQPISNFGAMKHKIGEMIAQTFTIESAVYRVSDLMQDHKALKMEEGASFGQATLEAAKEYSSECAIIKVAGSEILDYVVDQAVQIHGGYGYSAEYAVSKAYTDARINRIYEGTNEINRMLMVNQILKKAMKGGLDLTGPAWAVQKELTSFPSMSQPEGVFGHEVKAVKDFKKILLLVAGAAVKYQMDGHHNLKEEQEVLMNIADIMIDTFLAESLLLRVQKLTNLSNQEEPKVPLAILRLFIHDAQDRVSKSASDALSSFAKGDEQSIMLKGIRRFTKYPAQNVKELRRTIAAKCISENGYTL